MLPGGRPLLYFYGARGLAASHASPRPALQLKIWIAALRLAAHLLRLATPSAITAKT